MKKQILFILLAISLLIFYLLPLTIPQEISSQLESNIESLEKTKEKIEDFSADEIKEKYLAKEWTKIIKDDPKLNWIYKLNPVFKFLFGYEFSISWAFITALLIWFIIFSIYYPITKLIFMDFISSLGISIAISAITANVITEKAIDILSGIVKNIWWNFGIIIILIFILLLIDNIIPVIIKDIKKKRMKKRIAKLEVKSKKIEEEVGEFKSIKKGAESLKRGGS